MDREFVIKVSTPSDLSGAQATKAAFEAIGAAVEKVAAEEQAAGRSTDQLHGSFERMRDAQGRFVSLGESVNNTGKSMSGLSKETDGFLSKIEMGVGFGLGEKLLSGVEELGHALVETLHKGVEGLAEMQTLTNGLAATFRSVEPEKFGNFGEAQKAAVDTMDVLRTRANALGVDFRGLAESYSANLNALIEGGVTRPAQQIDLVSTLVQAATSKGVNGTRALTDSIDILNGRVGNIPLAKELGLQEAALKKAAESGELYSYIMSKLGGYQEGAAAGAATYQGTLNTLHNELDQLEQDLAKPTFDKLVTLMQGGKGVLGGSEASGVAQGIGDTLGGVLDDVQAKAGAFESFLADHPSFARALGLLPTVAAKATGLPFDDPNTLAQGAATNIQGRTANADVNAQIKLVKALEDEIKNAKDDKAVADARKAVEDAIAAATERTASAQGDAKDRAHEFLVELEAIQASMGRNLGNAPADTSAADRRAKQDTDAYAKYNARPNADLTGDAAADAEKREKSVDKAAKDLEKTYGFTEATARKIAEGTVAQAAFNAELDKTNKELEGVVAKEEKSASSAELASKLKGVYSDIMVGLPESSRIGLSDQPTGANLAATSKAVEDLPVGDGDQAALDAKKALVDKLKEAIALQKDFNDAVSKEGRQKEQADKNTKEAAANARQRADAIADEQQEIAISQARARGDEKTADALEKQRDIQREITRLMEQGVDYAEAQALATQKINSANDASDRKQSDQYARRHPGDLPPPINAKPVDTDPGGGLHTGPLGNSFAHTSSTTSDADPNGGLSTGGFGKGDAGATSTAGNALKGPTTAGAALGVPTGASSALADPTAHNFTDPIAEMNKAAGVTPPNTAAAGVGGALPPPGTTGAGGAGTGASGGASGGDSGLASAAQGTQKGAEGAQKAAEGMKSSQAAATAALTSAASSLQTLGSTLNDIKSTQDQQQQQLDSIQSTVDNLNAGG